MVKQVSNRDARRCVQNLERFKGSHTFAEWDANRYVVYSYGYHWPLFIYEEGKWYETEDKYSRTTTQHHKQLHPLCETEQRSAGDMDEIARLGVTKWMALKLRNS